MWHLHQTPAVVALTPQKPSLLSRWVYLPPGQSGSLYTCTPPLGTLCVSVSPMYSRWKLMKGCSDHYWDGVFANFPAENYSVPFVVPVAEFLDNLPQLKQQPSFANQLFEPQCCSMATRAFFLLSYPFIWRASQVQTLLESAQFLSATPSQLRGRNTVNTCSWIVAWFARNSGLQGRMLLERKLPSFSWSLWVQVLH